MNMNLTRSRWFTAYLMAGLFSGIAGSIYFTYSRVYLRDSLGENSNYVIGLLISFEQIPQFLGIVGGFLADYIGRRKLYSISLFSPILFIIIPFINPVLFPYIILVNSLIGSISGPAVSGAILAALNRSGKLYSIYVMAPTIGWIIGGIIPGLTRELIGSTGLFISIALLSYLSTILYFVFFPGFDFEKPRLSEIPIVFSKTWNIVLANTVVNGGLGIFWTLIGLEIYSETQNLLLYGLLLSSATALAGAVVRPLSGILVDRYEPINIIKFTLIAYIIIDTAILFTRGLPRIALWIIPIYPFRDTATTISISRRVSLKLQSTSAGLNMTMTSLSGLIVLSIISFTRGDIVYVYYIHIILLILGLILLLHDKLKMF